MYVKMARPDSTPTVISLCQAKWQTTSKVTYREEPVRAKAMGGVQLREASMVLGLFV